MKQNKNENANEEAELLDLKDSIIACIPGLWESRSDIICSIAKKSGGYLAAGHVIHKVVDGEDFSFQMEIREHDANLANAFESAGMRRFNEQQLDEIDKHTFCLYIVGRGNSLSNIKKIIDVCHALINAGGLAVKIENTGRAIIPEVLEMMATKTADVALIYDNFATYVDSESHYYTCGMHCFGLPDVRYQKNNLKWNEAYLLMRVFNLYNLMEAPN